MVRKAVRTARRAGRLKLRIAPTRGTRGRLGRRGSVSVRARIRFSPSAGTPQAQVRRIGLIKKRS